MTTPADDLASRVGARLRDIPDFPKPGILFKDITPVLTDPVLYGEIVDWMAQGWGRIDRLVAMESRGFLFAAAMVRPMGAGMALARKKGKLPFATESVDYALEYGHATLEMHVDAIRAGQRVLIVDDLLATGGTARAACDLVTRCGGVVVAAGFLVELTFLNGRDRLTDQRVYSVLAYED